MFAFLCFSPFLWDASEYWDKMNEWTKIWAVYIVTLNTLTAHVRKASSCPLSSSPSPVGASWEAPSWASFWSMAWAKAQNSGYMLDPKPNTAYLQKEIKIRSLRYAKWNAKGLNHMQTKQQSIFTWFFFSAISGWAKSSSRSVEKCVKYLRLEKYSDLKQKWILIHILLKHTGQMTELSLVSVFELRLIHTPEVNITFPLFGESPLPKVLVTTKRSVSFSRSQMLYSSMHRIWKA